MANWCDTDYAFEGNITEVLALHKKLSSTLNTKPKVDTDFGSGWLGNVAINHGLDWKTVPCRGHIYYIDDPIICDSHASFILSTETAWKPLTYIWDRIISDHYPSISYVYKAEEPGQLLYINTDTEGVYFPERYVIDMDIPKDVLGVDIYKYEIYESEADLLRDLNKITNRQFNSFIEASEFFDTIASDHIAIIQKYR